MSKPRPSEAVKLLMSYIYADGNLLKSILETLSEHYGDVDFVSAPMPFHYTDYYTEEMGSPLERRLIFFNTLIRAESLPEVKLYTNDVEDRASEGGKRLILTQDICLRLI
jgi:hypothetical protein